MIFFRNKKYKKLISILEQERDQFKDENSSLKNEIEQLKSQLESTQNKASEIDHLENLMKFENEHMKSGVMDIQKGLSDSVTVAKETLEFFSTINSEFVKRTKNLHKISSAIKGLSSISEQSGDAVQGMSSRAEEISSILSLIRGIAEQTNLLALNAAIEAARAGDAGRGFAVVADEVRGLADKTQKAITEINEVITALKENVQSVSNISSQLTGNIENAANEMANFENHMNEIDEKIKSYFKDINLTSDMIFMSLAKVDHMIWKINTYLSINNREPDFQFVDHHKCRLGKWYYEGEGKKYFSHSSHYDALEKPHSIVHNGTKDIFELIKEENIDYEKLMQAVKLMEDSSQEVFNILSEIAQDAMREQG